MCSLYNQSIKNLPAFKTANMKIQMKQEKKSIKYEKSSILSELLTTIQAPPNNQQKCVV